MSDPLIAPAEGAFTISTAWGSTTPFKAGGFPVTRAIYVGGAGDLKVLMFNGSTGLFPTVPAGSLMPIRAIGLSSSNTATSLVGIY